METEQLKRNLERLIENNPKINVDTLNKLIPYTAHGLEIDQSEVSINEAYGEILILTSLALLKKGLDPFKELNYQINHAFSHPEELY